MYTRLPPKLGRLAACNGWPQRLVAREVSFQQRGSSLLLKSYLNPADMSIMGGVHMRVDRSLILRIVARTAIGMVVLGTLMLIASAASFMQAQWARWATAPLLLAFVGGAFWAHYLLFGELAPERMATNVVVSAVILLLLRWGNRHDA
jgi:hypothetical protein